MIYLIIPILCFVLLAALFKFLVAPLLSPRNRESAWEGRIKGLNVILSVLMTAEQFESYLIVKAPDGAILSNMTFPKSKLRLEIPLVTPLQKSRREHALAILRNLDLDTRKSRNDGDDDALVCELEGPPVGAATVVRKIFAELYDVEVTTLLEFRIFAHWLDQAVIDRALDENRPGDKARPGV